MAEVENSMESVRMSTLINGGATAEPLKERALENGHARTGSLKYRRRNIVVKRDFPRGCGRFAERINGVSEEDGGSSKVGAENGTIVKPEPESIRDSGILGGSQAPELCNGLVQEESDLSKTLTTEMAKPLETSDQVEALEQVKALENETSTHTCHALDSETAERIETSDQLEGLELVKPLEHETSTHMSQQPLVSESKMLLETSDHVGKLKKVKSLEHETPTRVDQGIDSEPAKPSATLDEVEDPEPIQSVDPVETVLYETSAQIELPELSKNLEPLNGSATGLVLPRDPVLPETSEVSKVSDQPQLSTPIVGGTEKSCPLVNIPRRKALVVRHFPPGCGRNAPPMSREEYLKVTDSSKDTSADKRRPSGEHRPFENSVEDYAAPNPERVSDEDALSIKLKRNVTKEIGTKVQSKSEDDFSKNIAEHAPIRIVSETRNNAKQSKEKIKEGDASTGKFKGNLSVGIGDEDRVKSEEVFGKEMTEQVQVRTISDIKLKQEVLEETSIRSPRENILFRSNTNSQSVSNSTTRKDGFSKWKLGKEVHTSKGKSSKRQFLGEIQDEVDNISQSHGRQIVSLQPSGEMVIVQALMAAPNCPWRQGKRGLKSSSTIGTTRNKAKKHELVIQDKSASVSKKNKAESENSEGKSKRKKLPPAEMDAHQGLQLVLRDEEDTLEHVEVGENVPLNKKPRNFEVSPIPFGVHTSSGKGDGSKVTREKVRETLRFFQVIFRKFLQGEEAHPKDQGNTGNRIDLRAGSVLKKGNRWVNTEKILGPVPGVEVGDEFHYRVELAIVGLHKPFQGGIDSMKKNGEILATSIVASGGYPDDMDSSDVLIYSGQGGKPVGGEKHKQAEDQKLERGNLALKNAMDAGSPVRVIRGFKETNSSDSAEPRGKIITTYIYDGLYLVEDYWTESSTYGTSVFKFKLRRIPGQPELALKEVKKSRKSKVREGLCVVDISQGKEKMPIGAVNTIDDEKPPPFTYITKMIYPDWYKPIPPTGCDCTSGCLNSTKCSCAAKNGGEIPFNYDGAIVEAKPLVYECGSSCRCPPSCHNRVSQRGIKFQLEIFKTESRGWGVRSLTSIPSGSFVCEYTGELLQDKEAEKRTGNDEYLFDIGYNYNDHALWEGLPDVIPDLHMNSPCEVVEDAGYTIDAAQYGSIGRFINHSCSPNLYAQNVLYDHDDKRMPHIMLFAAENIPPLQEITYHYNYTIGQVYDAEGKVKEKKCCCGSAECSGRLY
ncbi:histone-lysine N-methyltransferase, H3 lysine-9 specific SUVH6-like [Macadamia integrifolia]|uniref:histone-lysine N-methyltransferase, H3 lysine-9 specific SUVH6-like n=1 Tax=Macadamia integrifolia TaxID=60698 RepID=UPI001C4F591B|nr:histone-lysine N-methyltransferase, H3 lysine-9 specific SUVH6-like [Macadamia integrifolia]XP_042510987.1 histone-lysine N-methyltransferase, H3 lysine-9 specific SUVH6-like [Macadamia integrifolia]XP_042510988.1 histone-lysine N-methyltransferase, H3 lysine-9 specific SUVH6-like [Macadamia integrifolia]XP_042510989.1 histone-lysine N-methyltransferase, H3 lysine-9 specific SUVH6-like [Macadamia integrifolia]XP_042510990.1 histone-lysine N-methyltransferase, H3 lysine-9 specific SUVH6-like 